MVKRPFCLIAGLALAGCAAQPAVQAPAPAPATEPVAAAKPRPPDPFRLDQMHPMEDGKGYYRDCTEAYDGAPLEEDLIVEKVATPMFPRAAFKAGVSGWADVETVTCTDGTAKSVRLLGEQPPGVFGMTALQASARNVYKVRTVDGKAVEVKGRRHHTYTIEAPLIVPAK